MEAPNGAELLGAGVSALRSARGADAGWKSRVGDVDSRTHASQSSPSSRVRAVATVAEVHGQQWMEERLKDIPLSKFGSEDIVMYSTYQFAPPPQFAGVWYKAGETRGQAGPPPVQYNLLLEASMVLIFCNVHSTSHLRLAYDIAMGINEELDQEAPPILLVPHSHDPAARTDPSRLREFSQLWPTIASYGIDDIIFGEPLGMKLACDIRSRILTLRRITRKGHDALKERIRILEHFNELEDVVDDIIWEYLRVRLCTDIPELSEEIPPGIPKNIGDFTVGQKLGAGQFGVVYKLHQNDGCDQVVKFLDKGPRSSCNDIVALAKQLQVLKALSSECRSANIAQFYEAYHSETHIVLRLEYGGPVDLYKRLSFREDNSMPLGVAKTLSVVAQCIDGLAHMHIGPRIAHCDIKPENIIVSETTSDILVKYVDFDTALFVTPGARCSGICGTFPFMAPEVVLSRKYHPFPLDLWSLGVVFLELFCRLNVLKSVFKWRANQGGSRGATSNSEKQRMQAIHKYFTSKENVNILLGRHMLQDLSGSMEDAKRLLQGQLDVIPSDRSTVHDILGIRQESFV